jgi:RNA polymerase sigma factor (sigma-70 family)
MPKSQYGKQERKRILRLLDSADPNSVPERILASGLYLESDIFQELNILAIKCIRSYIYDALFITYFTQYFRYSIQHRFRYVLEKQDLRQQVTCKLKQDNLYISSPELLDSISSLSSTDQAIVRGRIDGVENIEIARNLGCSVRWINKRLLVIFDTLTL